jgi:transcription-repair coupling factor (superfamily II helicase)
MLAHTLIVAGKCVRSTVLPTKRTSERTHIQCTRVHCAGLLVVDEEQKFGVNQKERLKALTTGVDVLTLTATPIPRTLHMSLSGIRDLSTIMTPPEGRQNITTYIMKSTDEVIQRAVARELRRDGQVCDS